MKFYSYYEISSVGSERLLKKVTKTFVVSGSTTGHIYLWDISSCFQSDSHEISQIGSFEAHQMGTNTLTIDEIPVPSEQQTDNDRQIYQFRSIISRKGVQKWRVKQ